MLGAMEAIKDPEVAPAGIVTLIDVPAQVFTVTLRHSQHRTPTLQPPNTTT